MGHGAGNYNNVTMASGDSLSTYIDLGRPYPTIYLEISSTPSNSQHQIRAAAVAAGPYNTVYHPAINSSTVTNNPYTISNITGVMIPIPGGLRFLKVYATGAMTNGHTYRIHYSDE